MGERNCGDPAEQCDDEALRQEQPNEATTTDAKGEANGDLALARRGATEPQIDHVGAGQEQDEQRHHREEDGDPALRRLTARLAR